MGITVYSLSWVMQDLSHQPYENQPERSEKPRPGIGLLIENGPRFVASCATLPSYSRCA